MKNWLYFSYFVGWLMLGITSISTPCAEEAIQNTTQIQPSDQQVENTKPSTPLQAKVGVFINDLYGFDLRNQSFNIVFWAWFVYPPSDVYEPEKSTEIVNSYGYAKNDFFAAPKPNNTYWSSMKFTGLVAHQWRIANFPFDSQKLQIILEDMKLDSPLLQYVADKENSKIASSVSLPDWKVIDFNLEIVTTTYPTTYGDPDVREGYRTYSRAIISITLERESTIKLFFNMFLALYVAFILSALAFLLPPSSPSRLSLATGGVFAVVANKYASDTILPLTTYVSLVDKLQIATLIFISVSAFISAILIHLDTQNKASAKSVNNITGMIFFISYVILNVYWVNQAMNRV